MLLGYATSGLVEPPVSPRSPGSRAWSF